MFSGKTILVVPLDWGLGHATRCVPLIRELSAHNTVLIGSTPLNRFYFSRVLANHRQLDMPSYAIRYSRTLPAWVKVLLQMPRLFRVMALENRRLGDICAQEAINVVISDCRYGLYNKKIRSILITHQLRLQVPVSANVVNLVNRRFLQRFDQVWVPDDAAVNLSGRLSDSTGVQVPVKFIGVKSQLMAVDVGKTIDCLVLLSGTEPQRTQFETLLMNKLGDTGLKITLVRGDLHGLRKTYPSNIHVIDFAYADEVGRLIASARSVICRSGYSTLMDLYAMGHLQPVLVATPGQPEQEYLAAHWHQKFNAVSIRQHDLPTVDLVKIMQRDVAMPATTM